MGGRHCWKERRVGDQRHVGTYMDRRAEGIHVRGVCGENRGKAQSLERVGESGDK